MTIREYTDPDWNELMSLYAAVGWTNYTDEPEMLRAAYTHSLAFWPHMKMTGCWALSEQSATAHRSCLFRIFLFFLNISGAVSEKRLCAP